MSSVQEQSKRGYVVCTAPRSGSNYLGQLLSSTGALGRPLEYFNGPARRVLDHPGYPDDPEAQMHAIVDLGATDNGVYGFKLFITQFEQVAATGWPRRLPGLSFIHLERRDVLGQALSWARALQTGQYRSTSASNGEPRYDGPLIAHCLSMIIDEQARWRAYFAVNGLRPLTLVYEDVARAPQTAIDAVAGLVGLAQAPQVDLDRIDLRVQRDSSSAEWGRRFVAEYGDMVTPVTTNLRVLARRPQDENVAPA